LPSLPPQPDSIAAIASIVPNRARTASSPPFPEGYGISRAMPAANRGLIQYRRI
jgi:hypothetical protein